MNHDLLTLSLSIGKYIIAVALMIVFYRFLYQDKTSYNHCRVYLLSIALVALLISQFNITIYTPPVKNIEVVAPKSSAIAYSASSQVMPQSFDSKPLIVEEPTMKNWDNELLTPENLVIAIYVFVALVLFILLFIQFFQILSLKRRGKVTIRDGFEVVESAEIPTPFSFYKTIFLSSNLSGTKLDMILKHEQWHIRHRHYLDVFVMEFLVRLFWFNPLLWWVRRELQNVSEFHVDRSVLDEGQDLYKYQSIIFEEVMGNNPYLANGFNNSFTKKRFIIMKNKNHNRYSTLRRALMLPFFLGVFSLLCFSIGKEELRYIVKNSHSTDFNIPMVTVDPTNNSTRNIVYTDASTRLLTYLKTVNVDSIKENSIGLKVSNEIFTDKIGMLIEELTPVIRMKTLDAFSVRQCIGMMTQILKLKVNGNDITQASFNEEFLTRINKSDLQQIRDELNVLQKNLKKISKLNSAKDMISGMSLEINKLWKYDFFTSILGEAMRNNKVDVGDLSEFKFNLTMELNGKIKFTGIEGCAFRELSFKCSSERDQVIDAEGMAYLSSKTPGFLIAIRKTKSGICFEGIRGTAWKRLSFECPFAACTWGINQNGESAVYKVPNEKSTISNENQVENSDNTSESDNNMNAVAQFDENAEVRKEAVSLLKDQQAIKQVVLFDTNSEVRLAALALLTDQEGLKQVAFFDENVEIRKRATVKLKSKITLKQVAEFDTSPEVRLMALKTLKNIK